MEVTYSLVQDGCVATGADDTCTIDDTGNRDADPLFVRAPIVEAASSIRTTTCGSRRDRRASTRPSGRAPADESKGKGVSAGPTSAPTNILAERACSRSDSFFNPAPRSLHYRGCPCVAVGLRGPFRLLSRS